MTRCHEHPNGSSRVLSQENWQCVAGAIWRGIGTPAPLAARCNGAQAASAQVHSLSMSSCCLNPALYSEGTFVSRGGSISHKQHLHAQTKPVYSPVGRSFPHYVTQRQTLNKLFRKASCHLQTVYAKQHEIIHCFNV